jgi:hypothetical protein
MNDDELIARFENCDLPKESFHHADHVKIAFLYLGRYSALEAIQRFSASLARFAAGHGKPDLYNETITWALLLLIRERMVRAGGRQTWEQFAAANGDLLSWKDNILRKYYQDATLRSDLARNTFIFPDRSAAHQ